MNSKMMETCFSMSFAIITRKQFDFSSISQVLIQSKTGQLILRRVLKKAVETFRIYQSQFTSL
jgi:hypothetical protein